MAYDVELMRELLLNLEARQASPRANIVLSIDDEAITLGRTQAEVVEGLVGLLELDYLEGPGLEESTFFIFRKLTLKGTRFVRTVRRPSDWERLKRHFERRRLEGTL